MVRGSHYRQPALLADLRLRRQESGGIDGGSVRSAQVIQKPLCWSINPAPHILLAARAVLFRIHVLVIARAPVHLAIVEKV